MSRRITAGMTMALPERVDRLVAGMGCHRLASLDYHMRNAILGHISMNVLSPKDASFNPEQLDFIKHSIALYKASSAPSCPSAAYTTTPSKAAIICTAAPLCWK